MHRITAILAGMAMAASGCSDESYITFSGLRPENAKLWPPFNGSDVTLRETSRGTICSKTGLHYLIWEGEYLSPERLGMARTLAFAILSIPIPESNGTVATSVEPFLADGFLADDMGPLARLWLSCNPQEYGGVRGEGISAKCVVRAEWVPLGPWNNSNNEAPGELGLKSRGMSAWRIGEAYLSIQKTFDQKGMFDGKLILRRHMIAMSGNGELYVPVPVEESRNPPPPGSEAGPEGITFPISENQGT